jgi:hypothetical protein
MENHAKSFGIYLDAMIVLANGMRDGQTYEQVPQPMQSLFHSFSAFSMSGFIIAS